MLACVCCVCVHSMSLEFSGVSSCIVVLILLDVHTLITLTYMEYILYNLSVYIIIYIAFLNKLIRNADIKQGIPILKKLMGRQWGAPNSNYVLVVVSTFVMPFI